MRHASRLLSLLVLTLALLSACDHDHDVPASEHGRTVLIYMAGHNSLGYRGYHHQDSLEIANGTAAMERGDRLLMFIDDGTRPRLYLFTRESRTPQLVRTWDKAVNAADAATLSDVLTWSAHTYPADDYGLVLWSHASGWLPSAKRIQSEQQGSPASPAGRPLSFGIDVGEDGNMKSDLAVAGQYPDEMEVDDLAEAIHSSGVHLSYILFDCCLMQNVEVCYALRHAADYIIGSPMAISANGGFYTDLLEQGLFSSYPPDIVETYYRAIAGKGSVASKDDFGIVISAVRTDRLEALAAAVRQAWQASTFMQRQSPDLGQVQWYQAYNSKYYYRPHNYDMADAFRATLSPEALPAVLRAIDDAVVAHAATDQIYVGPNFFSFKKVKSEAVGLSMFFPQDIYTRNAQACRIGDLNALIHRTAWYDACGMSVTGW